MDTGTARRRFAIRRLSVVAAVATLGCIALPEVASATQGQALVVTKTAQAKFTRTFDWTIDKQVDKTSVEAAGGTATFNYTVVATRNGGTDNNFGLAGTIKVSNPNGWAVEAVVTDQMAGCDLNPSAAGVQSSKTVTVPASGSVSIDYICSLGNSEPYGSVTNSVHVTSDVGPTNASSPAVDFTTPSSTNNKTVDVFDQLAGSAETMLGSCGTGANTSPCTFTYSRVFPSPASATCASHTNDAWLTSGGYELARDQVTVSVCNQAQALTVSKTANPTFTRTFDWSVAKSVDHTKITTTGNLATFNYTVVVTKSAPVDSGFKVSGQITITNPNAFPLANATVTDAVTNGGTCTVTGGTGITVPANSTQVLAYACTYAAAPTSASGTNTASVTYDSFCPPAGNDAAVAVAPDCTVTRVTATMQPVAFSFTTPTTVLHDSVNVTDIFDLTPIQLSQTAINATTTFVYGRMVAVPASGCVTKTNTAIATAVDNAGFTRPSAPVNVEACRQAGNVGPAGTPTKPERTSITVSKAANKDVVRAGKNVKFTIRFKVTGKAKAVDAKVCDKLPSAMVFVAAPGAVFQKGQACWLRKNVKAGTTLVFRVTAKVDASAGVGKACNNVVASASNAGAARDKVCVRLLPQAGRVGGGTVGVTG